MNASDIIEALGGRTEIAALTTAKPNAVTQWRKAGIPPFYWHVLVRAAEEKKVSGISFETLAATRQVAPRATEQAASP
jgi:hypothetical protein